MPWQANFIQLSPTSVKFDIRNYPANFPLFIQVDKGHNLSTFASIGNLEWSTYVGGNVEDQFLDVKTDNIGNVYATGFTASNTFPQFGGYQTSNVTGDYDAVIAKFDSSGQRKYATYFGSTTAYEEGRSIEVYPNGDMIICGHTTAAGTALPTKKSTGINSYYQNSSGGSWDGFICKLKSTGDSLRWSTYLGGSPP
ncbi:MAG: hypothetical protein HY841_15785 [Bacteroidetes bacterium]|nr:hypothetical protein [Bacteroidota bacterium]